MGSHGNGVCRQFQHRMSTGPPRTFAPASTTRNAQTEIPQQDRPPECAEILVLFRARARSVAALAVIRAPREPVLEVMDQTEESLKPSPTGQALPADSGNPQIQKSLPATDGDDWPYRLFVEALPRLVPARRCSQLRYGPAQGGQGQFLGRNAPAPAGSRLPGIQCRLRPH